MKSLLPILAIGMGLAACAPEPSSKSKSLNPSAPRLSVLTWEDYFPEEVLDQFTEEHGVELEVISYSNSEDLRSMIVSAPQRYDVIVADDLTLRTLIHQKLLVELDKTKLPHLSNLGKYAGQDFDPGNDYSVPYLWGTTLLTYNSDLVERAPTRWKDLWNPAIVRDGLVGMLNEPTELFSVALLSLGYGPNTATEDQMIEARELLLKQFDQVNLGYMNEIEIIEALENGTCAAAMQYSGDAILAAETNPSIKAVIPEEGAAMWMDNFAISRESTAKAQAYSFLDFMLEAQTAAACAEWNWYASPNQAAEEILDPELLEDPTIYPPTKVLERCFYYSDSRNYQRLVGLHMRPLKERAKLTETLATAE